MRFTIRDDQGINCTKELSYSFDRLPLGMFSVSENELN
jgi:hypothetical protein